MDRPLHPVLGDDDARALGGEGRQQGVLRRELELPRANAVVDIYELEVRVLGGDLADTGEGHVADLNREVRIAHQYMTSRRSG